MRTEQQEAKKRYKIEGQSKTYRTVEEASEAKVKAMKKTLEGVDMSKLSELLKK